MNEILVKLEELNLEDLNYVLEYLTGLISERKHTGAEGGRAFVEKDLSSFNAREQAASYRTRKTAEKGKRGAKSEP